MAYPNQPYSIGQGPLDITEVPLMNGLIEEPQIVVVDNLLVVDGYYLPVPNYPSATLALTQAMAASALWSLGNVTASASGYVNATQVA